MKRFLLLLPVLLIAAAAPAQAEKIKYYEDPVYKPLNKDDSHPMSDLIALAEGGDSRAQFILGDLYAKGKGGLVKNIQKGGYWFEESAKAGYGPAFIRLGALAKNNKDPVAAWSWYDLGGDLARGADARYARKARDEVAGKLSSEQLGTARGMASDWKQRRAKEIADKKKAAQDAEAEKARVAKEVEEAEAAAGAKANQKKSDVKPADAGKPSQKDPAPRKAKPAEKKPAETEKPVVKERKLNE